MNKNARDLMEEIEILRGKNAVLQQQLDNPKFDDLITKDAPDNKTVDKYLNSYFNII